jgi:hypothetical protein
LNAKKSRGIFIILMKNFNAPHLWQLNPLPSTVSAINAGRSPFFPVVQPGDGAGVVQVSCPGSVSPAGPVSARLPQPPRNLVQRLSPAGHPSSLTGQQLAAAG